jgi:methylglutaconyl-CoA hydratase
MSTPLILYSSGERRARITLNRPAKRNALDATMVHELTLSIAAAAKDPAVKAVVLQAEGDVFCAGADLEELRRIRTNSLEENQRDSQALAALLRSIYEMRKPVVALVDGPALAGGCGLVSVCDFVIATAEHASFGYPEVRIGFVPAIVMSFLVNRVGEGRARSLVLQGRTVSAQEAWNWGLVTSLVSAKDLHPAAETLLTELCSRNSATAMGLCKEVLSKIHGMTVAEAVEFGANMNAAARMTEDCKRGVDAFLAKQKPDW